MFENPRRGRQAGNFTTNIPKIVDLKSSSGRTDIFRELTLGAPANWKVNKYVGEWSLTLSSSKSY